MSYSAGSTASAVLLDEVKTTHWGPFQRVCDHAQERLGNLNMASASLLDMHLGSRLGCVNMAVMLLGAALCDSYTSSR